MCASYKGFPKSKRSYNQVWHPQPRPSHHQRGFDGNIGHWTLVLSSHIGLWPCCLGKWKYVSKQGVAHPQPSRAYHASWCSRCIATQHPRETPSANDWASIFPFYSPYSRCQIKFEWQKMVITVKTQGRMLRASSSALLALHRIRRRWQQSS